MKDRILNEEETIDFAKLFFNSIIFRLAYIQVKREGKLNKNNELIIDRMKEILTAIDHLKQLKRDKKGNFTKYEDELGEVDILKLFNSIKDKEK